MRIACVLVLGMLMQACGGGGAEPPEEAAPGGLYATFAVGDEIFHAAITHPDGMDQVRAHWTRTSDANIPTGELECTQVAWNEPWHWHLLPETVRMAEVTVEVCDAAPSYIEANCPTFGTGTYCPWSAELTNLQDCTTDPDCPVVPRPD